MSSPSIMISINSFISSSSALNSGSGASKKLDDGLDLKNRYGASRKFDLAVSAEKLFSGQVIAEAEVKERALAWLPTPMRFGPEEESSVELAADAEHVGEAATQNEAAEMQSSDSIAEAA